MPRTSGRPTVRPPRPNTRGSPRTTSRPISAMPKVLSARCRPRRRTAGRATSPPSTAATTPPSSMPSTLSPPKVLPVTKAPMPTNRYWASDTCPDSPVRATSDRAMVAMTSAAHDVALEVGAGRALASTRHAGDEDEPPVSSDERRVGHPRLVAADDPTGGQPEGRARGGRRRRGRGRGWRAAIADERRRCRATASDDVA